MGRDDNNGELIQGTLEMLVLKALARGPLHGYAIAEWIHQSSQQVLRVEEGALYPALHRMEQDGWIKGKWGTTDKNRQARFYALTASGKRQLADEEASWLKLTEGVARVLGVAYG